MARRLPRILLLAVSVAAGGAVSSVEHAARATDPQEQQLAQALFDEGRRLMDAKRYGDACPKLAESQRLDPGGGTLLNLAICHEKEGKLATAKNDFDEALVSSTRDGRKDRQKIAREHLAAIEGMVPRITVMVAPASEIDGLEVKLDGLVLRRAAWGVATPVDPGNHVVEATATGRAPWSSTVQLEAKQTRSVDVPVLGPLSPLPLGGAGAAAPARAPSAVVTDPGAGVQRPMIVTEPAANDDLAPLAEVTPRKGKANPVFYTVLASTLLLGGASVVTGAMAFASDRKAKDGCLPDRKYCRDQDSADAADQAATLAWVSTVTVGLAAAGFVALLILPSHKADPSSALRASAAALPGGGAFALSGAF